MSEEEGLGYVIDSQLTVSELIKKLQKLPEEFQNALVLVGFMNEDGEGEERVLNSIELDEEGGIVSLLSDDYDYENN